MPISLTLSKHSNRPLPAFWWGAFIFVFLLIPFFSCQKESTPVEYQRLQSLYIPMRDGVRIAVDVWLPEDLGSERKIPAIMYSTRYWRASDIVDATIEQDHGYARANRINGAGYALILVDARGTGASFGTRPYEMTVDEVKDYGEIADWIIKQPWSNGRIGAYGVSYPGNTAEMLMVNQRPSVKVVAPLYNDFNYYDLLVEPGGVLLNFFIDAWGHLVSALDNNDICAAQGITGEQCEEVRKRILGVKSVDEDPDKSLLKEALSEHRANVKLHESMTEFRDDPFGPKGLTDLHSRANASGHLEEIEASGTAIYVRVGWLDAATVNGALSRYLSVNNLQKVIIGPWSHGGGHHIDPFCDPDTPTDPPMEQQWQEMLEYFDLFLKDQDPRSLESSITYFTMGTGVWNETKTWPPEGFTPTPWYLGPQGTLSRTKPAGTEGKDSYLINYEATTGKSNRWYTQLGGSDVIYPDRAEEDKKLLTYTSPPMANDIVITGHPLVTLYISSTAKDGAFFVYLEDVDEKGRVTYITEGHLRAMCRKTSDSEPPFKVFGPYRTFTRDDSAPLIKDEIVDLTFDLIATSVLIKKGHRIRLAIAGADKDSFDRFPRDGSIPSIRVERNRTFPSCIVLPVKALQ
jgi:putative CocE/NonD family hydrolase